MRICSGYLSVPRAPAHDQALMEFMSTQCNFLMEHADGSFMDHLQFCYEYSHAHFKGHSPRVMLLHSILGAATNQFPMPVDKLDNLEKLVTEEEMVHINAFPSVARLFLTSPAFLNELVSLADEGKLETIKSMTYHRVMDNQQITMTAEQLWVHLNYHMIHWLDFLPTCNWKAHVEADLPFQICMPLHRFLTSTGKLKAEVNLDLKSGQSGTKGEQMTLGSFIDSLIPNPVLLAMARKQIKNFSKAVNHSLDYQLNLTA